MAKESDNCKKSKKLFRKAKNILVSTKIAISKTVIAGVTINRKIGNRRFWKEEYCPADEINEELINSIEILCVS